MSDEAGRGSWGFVQQRALSSLLAATSWVALCCLVPSARPTEKAAGLVALTGCAFVSLFSITVCFGTRNAPAPDSHTRGWQRALTVGLALAVAPLAALGAVLHARTHHRPLGATTFAILGAAVAALCVVAARGISAPGRCRISSRATSLSLVGAGAALGAGTLASRLALVSPLRSSLIHLALCLPMLALALRWPSRRTMEGSRSALPIAAASCIGWAWLLQSYADVRAVVQSAPVLGGIVGLTLR